MDREWYIELKWNCRSCDTKDILGRHKRCPSCGNPREEAEMEMTGLEPDAGGYNRAPQVTDSERLREAQAGADWFCPMCKAGNKGDGNQCESCGGSRNADVYRLPPPSRPAPPPSRQTTYQPPPPVKPPRPKQNPSPPFQEETTKSRPLSIGCFAAIILSCLAFLAVFLSTQVVPGTVKDKTWEHRIKVESWQQTTLRAWADNTRERPEVPPVMGQGGTPGIQLISGSCGREYFGEGPSYTCGSKEEKYDCSTTSREECGTDCTSMGNGYAKCKPKYCTKKKHKTCTRMVEVRCTDPIYKDRCTYATQEWRAVTTLTEKGHGDELRWPKLSADDRTRGRKSATYVITIAYGEADSTKVDEETEAAYLRWPLGGAVDVEVNPLGIVRDVRLSNKEQ